MKKLTLLLIVPIAFTAAAQNRASTSYFGSMIVDFRTEPPTVLQNDVPHAHESPASICDENGNLLFYSNGGRPIGYDTYETGVWNFQHTLIDNEPLIDTAGCFSSWNGAVIVPAPVNKKTIGQRFYLLMNDCIESSVVSPNSNSGLTYALVDMSLNGGTGGILEKRQVVVPYSSTGGHSAYHEPVAACMHANNLDYWIFSYTNDSIFRIRLSEGGFSDFETLFPEQGQLTVSPARNFLATANKVYALDAATGDLTLAADLGDMQQIRSIVFSPAGNLLYVSYEDYTIYQYNLAAPDILASGFLLTTLDTYCRLDLMPNYHIYIRRWFDQGYGGEILCPNTAGIQCGLQMVSPFDLNGGTVGQFTNVPAHYLHHTLMNCFAEVDETAFAGVTVFPNPSATGIFQVEGDPEIEEATVLDPAGKVVLSPEIKGGKTEIDLSGFTAGVYLLQLRKGNGTAYRKLVLAR